MKFSSILSQELRQKHGKRTVRPREGDSVKILKGEFKGIEGKVTKVDASSGTINVEGVTREKVAGGTAPVPINASNVFVTGLNLEDKLRKKELGGG